MTVSVEDLAFVETFVRVPEHRVFCLHASEVNASFEILLKLPELPVQPGPEAASISPERTLVSNAYH